MLWFSLSWVSCSSSLGLCPVRPLNASKDGDCAASLSTLFQCPSILTGFPYVQMEFHVVWFVPVASYPLTGPSEFASFTFSTQISICIDENHALSRQNRPSFLSLSPCERCFSIVAFFMAQPWFCQQVFVFLLIREPKTGPTLQMQPHQCWAEGRDRLPRPAGSAGYKLIFVFCLIQEQKSNGFENGPCALSVWGDRLMLEHQLVFLSAAHIPEWGGKNPKGAVKFNCDVCWVKYREPEHEFLANHKFKGGNSVLSTLLRARAKWEQSKVKSCVEHLFILSLFWNAVCCFLVLKPIFKAGSPLWIVGSASRVCFLLLGTSASLRLDAHGFSTPPCDRSWW